MLDDGVGSERAAAGVADTIGAPMSSFAVTLHLAAAPRAVDEAGGRATPLAPRDAALLAWLALEGPTPRARLAALLWPASDGEAARNVLRQRLFQLRKSVGFDLVSGTTTLALAEGVRHDLDDADTVLGETPGEDLAPGEFTQWLETHRAQRRGRVRSALVALVDQAEQARDWADALIHARELLALEPLSEPAHRRVMRLHYLAGDRAAALLAFDACERVLKDEVGARPSAETLALLRTVEAAEPAAGVAPALRGVPAGMLRPPHLVGRGVQLDAALLAWQAGRAFCLEGEAGMGKSRLLQEIAARHGGCIEVRARPGDAVVPFASLTRLLRAVLAQHDHAAAQASACGLGALLPELARGARDATSTPPPGAMAKALSTWVATLSAAGVEALIVDDLHFADTASIELLGALAGAEGALRWGFARRPAEGAAALADFEAALIEEQRLDPVPLPPLTREQLAQLVGSLGLDTEATHELAASLHQHSGGNPLFALETLRQAWLEQRLAGGRLPRPVSITRLIERRSKQLGVAALRLARCAAVAGTDFSIDLAARVLAVPAIDLSDAWAELEAAQVFVDGSFAHDLIHEVVLAGVPPQIARHLHGEVASYLDERRGAPASIAAHWLAAGEVDRALPQLNAAARGAALQQRFAEAAQTFEREASLRLDRGDTQGAFAAAMQMRKAAFEMDLATHSDTALALLDRAAATPLQRAQAEAERADVCMHRGRMVEAEAAVEAGLRALGGLAEPGLRAALCQHLAGVRVWQMRTAEAHELLCSIEAHLAAHGQPEQQAHHAQAMALVLDHLDRPAESLAWGRRASDQYLAAHALPQAAQVLLNVGVAWRDAGDLDRADTVLDEAQALIASLPEGAIPYSSLDINRGLVARDRGHYAAALEGFGRAIERGRIHTPGWVPLFLCHRAQAWLDLGQFARAQQDLDAAGAADAPPLAQARRELLRARLARRLGQDPGPSIERAIALVGPKARAISRQRLALARCVTIDPRDALAVAGEVLDAALASGRHGIVRAARARLCQACLALDHRAEAARHAQAIVELRDEQGTDDVYRGEVWLAATRALVHTDAGRAQEALRTAVAWLHDCAERHVAPEFRDAFLHRNPVNRELLALTQRLGPAPG